MSVIKPGVKVRIIGRHESTADGQQIPVVGAGPNVGRTGVVTRWCDEYPFLDNIWEVDAGSPVFVTYWGNVLQLAAFSQHILEVIPDETPVVGAGSNVGRTGGWTRGELIRKTTSFYSKVKNASNPEAPEVYQVAPSSCLLER